MSRQHTTVNVVVTGNHRNVSPATEGSSNDSDNYSKIEDWRHRVDTMRTSSRHCERSRLYDHLRTRSVLDRAIESLVSHTEPLYRPEGRGRHGCFGEYSKVRARPITGTPRKHTGKHPVETSVSGELGDSYPFVSHSPSKTTVSTMKEFIYNDARLPKPDSLDDLRADRTNGGLSESKRASKILERQISDIVDRRKTFGDKKKNSVSKSSHQGYSNLPSADEYVYTADGDSTASQQQLRKKIGAGDRQQKKNGKTFPGKILTLEDKNMETNADTDRELKSQPRSPTKVTFSECPEKDPGDNARTAKPKPNIDWSQVNATTGDVNTKGSEQRLLKTFAKLYTDVPVDELGDEEQNVDRELTAYKTSGRATLGVIEQPVLPDTLRKE